MDGSDEREADRSNGIDVAYSTIHMRSSHDSIDVRVNDDDDDDDDDDEVVEVKENDYDHDYGVDEDNHDHSDHHHGQHHYDSIRNDLIDITASINHLEQDMPHTQDTTTITNINFDTTHTVHHHQQQHHHHHHHHQQQQESYTRFTIGQYDMI